MSFGANPLQLNNVFNASRTSDRRHSPRADGNLLSETGHSSMHTHAYAPTPPARMSKRTDSGGRAAVMTATTATAASALPTAHRGPTSDPTTDPTRITDAMAPEAEPPRVPHDDDEAHQVVNSDKGGGGVGGADGTLTAAPPLHGSMASMVTATSLDAAGPQHSPPQQVALTDKYESLTDLRRDCARRRSNDSAYASATVLTAAGPTTITIVPSSPSQARAELSFEDVSVRLPASPTRTTPTTTTATPSTLRQTNLPAHDAAAVVPDRQTDQHTHAPVTAASASASASVTSHASATSAAAPRHQRRCKGSPLPRQNSHTRVPTNGSDVLEKETCAALGVQQSLSPQQQLPLEQGRHAQGDVHTHDSDARGVSASAQPTGVLPTTTPLQDNKSWEEAPAAAEPPDPASGGGGGGRPTRRLRTLWKDTAPSGVPAPPSPQSDAPMSFYGGDRPPISLAAATTISRNLDAKAFLNTRVMRGSVHERRRFIVSPHTPGPSPSPSATNHTGGGQGAAATDAHHQQQQQQRFNVIPSPLVNARGIHSGAALTPNSEFGSAGGGDTVHPSRPFGSNLASVSFSVEGPAGTPATSRASTGHAPAAAADAAPTALVPPGTGSNSASLSSVASRLRDSTVVIGGGIGSGLMTPTDLSLVPSSSAAAANATYGPLSRSPQPPREGLLMEKPSIVQRARSFMASRGTMEVPVAAAGATASDTGKVSTSIHGSGSASLPSYPFGSTVPPPPPPPVTTAEHVLARSTGAYPERAIASSSSSSLAAAAVAAATAQQSARTTMLASLRTGSLRMAPPPAMQGRPPWADAEEHAQRLRRVQKHGVSSIEEAIELSDAQTRWDNLVGGGRSREAQPPLRRPRPPALFGLFGMLERSSKFDEFGALFAGKRGILTPFLADVRVGIHELSTNATANRSFDILFHLLRDDGARERVGEEFYSEPVNSWPWHMLYLVCCFRVTAAEHGHDRLFTSMREAGGLFMMGKGVFAALAVAMSRAESSLAVNTAKMYLASFYVGILMREKQEEHEAALSRTSLQYFGMLLANIPIASLRMLVEQANLGRRPRGSLSAPDTAQGVAAAAGGLNPPATTPYAATPIPQPSLQRLQSLSGGGNSANTAGPHRPNNNNNLSVSQNLISSPVFYLPCNNFSQDSNTSSRMPPPPGSPPTTTAPTPQACSPGDGSRVATKSSTGNATQPWKPSPRRGPAAAKAEPHSEIEVSRIISTRSAVVCGHPLDLMRLDVLLSRFADCNGVKIFKDYIPATAPENSRFYNRNMAFDIVGYWDRMGVSFTAADLGMPIFSPVDGEPVDCGTALFARRIAEAASFENQDLTYSLQHLRDGDVLLDFSVHSLAVGRLVDWGKKRITVLSAPGGRVERSALYQPRRSQQSASMRETLGRLGIVNDILRKLSDIHRERNNRGNPQGQQSGGGVGRHRWNRSPQQAATVLPIIGGSSNTTDNVEASASHPLSPVPSPLIGGAKDGDGGGDDNPLHSPTSSQGLPHTTGAASIPSSLNNSLHSGGGGGGGTAVEVDKEGDEDEAAKVRTTVPYPPVCIDLGTTFVELGLLRRHNMTDDEAPPRGGGSGGTKGATTTTDDSSSDGEQSTGERAVMRPIASFSSTRRKMESSTTLSLRRSLGPSSRPTSPDASPSPVPSATVTTPPAAAAVPSGGGRVATVRMARDQEREAEREMCMSLGSVGSSSLRGRRQQIGSSEEEERAPVSTRECGAELVSVGNALLRTSSYRAGPSRMSSYYQCSTRRGSDAAVPKASVTSLPGDGAAASARRWRGEGVDGSLLTPTTGGTGGGQGHIPLLVDGSVVVVPATTASVAAAAPAQERRGEQGGDPAPARSADTGDVVVEDSTSAGATPGAANTAATTAESGQSVVLHDGGTAGSGNNHNNGNGGIHSPHHAPRCLTPQSVTASPTPPSALVRRCPTPVGRHSPTLPRSPQPAPSPAPVDTQAVFMRDDYVVHANAHYKGVINVYQVAPLIKYYEMQFGVVLCDGAVLFSVMLSEQTGIEFPPYMLLMCPNVFALLELWDVYDFINRWCIE